MSDYSIQNVVATADLHQKIHLPSLKKAFVNVEYRPEEFPGLIYRLRRPKTTTLIFSSGKMVCTGAKSEKIARRAVRKVVRDLKENDVVILGQPEVFIQNIVATTNFNGLVDLEFAADIMDNVMYEPEQFPGLIYRMDNPHVVMLIFASGKSVITGAKSEEAVVEAVKRMKEELDEGGYIYSN
ncbi:MAG: TATA-box-binding protein [Candidatus Bathyarchaeota archaeon]|jgi:transcription initiation factor TFIID TATA-box-binding protein